MLSVILMVKKLLGRFTKKSQYEFRVETFIKTKSDKVYVKWKGFS